MRRPMLWLVSGFTLSALLLVTAVGAADLEEATEKLAKALCLRRSVQLASVEADGQVYLVAGEEAGLVPGMTFDIVRLGEEIIVGGQVLGHKETHVGKVQVTAVRQSLAIAKTIEGKAKAGDVGYPVGKNPQRLAVLEFTLNNRPNEFTRDAELLLSEKLHAFGKSSVERAKLEQILREHKLVENGPLDPKTAAELGKFAGAEAVVLGEVLEEPESAVLHVKLVDVETGEILAEARALIDKTPKIQEKIKKFTQSWINREASIVTGPEVQPVYYEDFSTTPEGGLPEGWTEGELFAVQHRGNESYLALSRTGDSVVKSKTIQFPKNFIMEVRLNIVGKTNAAVVLSHSLIGESLKIQVWYYSGWWYLKIDGSDDKQFHFGNKTTLQLIKINDIFRLIANGDIHFSGRLPKYKEFDHVRFEFSDMNVGVLSIAVSPDSE